MTRSARGAGGRLAGLAGLVVVGMSLSACATGPRFVGMNETTSGVVLRVTATDGRLTDFWLEGGAAGRLVADGGPVTPTRVQVLAYPGCSLLFDQAWSGDRVRIRESGEIRLESNPSAPDGQLPLTDRCS